MNCTLHTVSRVSACQLFFVMFLSRDVRAFLLGSVSVFVPESTSESLASLFRTYLIFSAHLPCCTRRCRFSPSMSTLPVYALEQLWANNTAVVHSPSSIVPQSASIPFSDMKDVSISSTRQSRNPLVYPKKRPSPHGITKSRKSPLLPAHGPVRRTPRSAKSALVQQRHRELQILALRREGVLLEEEYRDEISYYMHDMEVSPLSHLTA